MMAFFNKKETTQFLYGEDVAVYFNEQGTPCFSTQTTDGKPRLLIASIPKSGTYLLGRIVEELGFIDTQIHIHGGGKSYTDYRFANADEARLNPKSYNHTMSVDKILRLVLPGQFILSHLGQPRLPDNTNMAVMFLYRNLRDCFVSFMRWHAKTGRGTAQTHGWGDMTDGPEKLLRYAEAEGDRLFKAANFMRDWLKEKANLCLRYEDLAGLNGPGIQTESFLEVIKACGSDVNDPTELIKACLGQDTMTYNPRDRTDRESYWNDEVENKFDELGLKKLNQYYGYE